MVDTDYLLIISSDKSDVYQNVCEILTREVPTSPTFACSKYFRTLCDAFRTS